MPEATKSRSGMLSRLKFPTREDKDELINEHINEPLARAGHEDIGAAISAGLSAAAEMAIPESAEELALAAMPIPGGKLMKKMAKLKMPAKVGNVLDYGAAKAMTKEARIAAEEAAPVLDYAKMNAAEKAAEVAKREKLTQAGDTLYYPPGQGAPISEKQALRSLRNK